MQETPIHSFTLTKYGAFRRIVKFLNPDETPQDLAGSIVKLYVEPTTGSSFEITTSSPATYNLKVEPTTTLSVGIDAVVISLSLVDTKDFAKKGFVKIDNEIIEYGARTLTTLTSLTRGAAGTTAATHANGATVRALGQVRIYISDETVTAYTWRRAEFRFEIEDSVGDKKPKFVGYFTFEKSYAI
jgi:hypothetical protein